MATTFDELNSMSMAKYKRADVSPASQRISTVSSEAQWIWWWFRYFHENPDYKAYCIARRTGDDTARAGLEAEFSRIADLYADWGDIHALKPMGRAQPEWRSWLHEHFYLFFPVKPEISQVSSPTDEIEAQHMLVQIPLALPRHEVVRLFTEFVARHYAPSPARQLLPEKYPLYAPRGKIDSSTFDAVRKAYYVEFASEVWYQNAPYQKLKHAETALKIMDIAGKEELGFKTWDEDGELIRRHHENKLSKADLDSYKKMVKRYKDDYAGYVANTIHGIFPKKEIDEP
jgi:hypothetical protein